MEFGSDLLLSRSEPRLLFFSRQPLPEMDSTVTLLYTCPQPSGAGPDHRPEWLRASSSFQGKARNRSWNLAEILQ